MSIRCKCRALENFEMINIHPVPIKIKFKMSKLIMNVTNDRQFKSEIFLLNPPIGQSITTDTPSKTE
jgi:hypothetical protein